MQLQPLFGSLPLKVRAQTELEVTASRGKQRGDVQIRGFLHHNGAPCDLVFDLTLAHERWGDTRPFKDGQASSPEQHQPAFAGSCQGKTAKYLSDCATNRYISFLPAVFSTSGNIDAEFLRLLFYHAHRESEKFFRITGQLAQPSQDYVFSKRAAFFNGLKKKVGHIMSRAAALRVNLDLQPSAPSLPRTSARNQHAHHLYALNLSHHILPPHPGA